MQGWAPFASNTINLVGLTLFFYIHRKEKKTHFFMVLCNICFLFLLHNNKDCYFDSALQLHPDKNTHPKAEIAFKLVSEVSFWYNVLTNTDVTVSSNHILWWGINLFFYSNNYLKCHVSMIFYWKCKVFVYRDSA